MFPLPQGNSKTIFFSFFFRLFSLSFFLFLFLFFNSFLSFPLPPFHKRKKKMETNSRKRIRCKVNGKPEIGGWMVSSPPLWELFCQDLSERFGKRRGGERAFSFVRSFTQDGFEFDDLSVLDDLDLVYLSEGFFFFSFFFFFFSGFSFLDFGKVLFSIAEDNKRVSFSFISSKVKTSFPYSNKKLHHHQQQLFLLHNPLDKPILILRKEEEEEQQQTSQRRIHQKEIKLFHHHQVREQTHLQERGHSLEPLFPLPFRWVGSLL